MPTLKDLPGLPKGDIDAIFVTNLSQLKKSLSPKNVCTSAGDNGALNVYYDSKGNIRCEAFRYCATVDCSNFKFLYEAYDWFKKWIKNIN